VLAADVFSSEATMRRRDFINFLGGAAASWPLAARAQQPARVYNIAIFSSARADFSAYAAFSEALRQLGWIEGKNVVLVNRTADNRLDRLPELAVELVRLKVDIIVTAGTLASLAAKHATTTIPIVMAAVGDPLGSGKSIASEVLRTSPTIFRPAATSALLILGGSRT
jgi:putative tryptophan/tyrosine transport system substrate-binding protein